MSVSKVIKRGNTMNLGSPVLDITKYVRNSSYEDVTFLASSTDGYFIISLNVHPPESNHDVGVFIYDSANYNSLIQNRKIIAARSTGSTSTPTLPVHYEQYVKLNTGILVFIPKYVGNYYLVIDNTHAPITSKTVFVKTYWVQSIETNIRQVRQTLIDNGWGDTLRIFDKANIDIQYKDLTSACNNIRTAFITVWVKVCEKLSNNTLHFDAGKSTDLSVLEKILRDNGVSEDFASLVRRHWATISELTKIERKGGKEPPEYEVYYGYELSLSTITYLLSLITTRN